MLFLWDLIADLFKSRVIFDLFIYVFGCWLPMSVVWSKHMVFVWSLLSSDSSSWVAVWFAQIRCQMYCSNIYGMWLAQIRCQMCLLLKICHRIRANQMSDVLSYNIWQLTCAHQGSFVYLLFYVVFGCQCLLSDQSIICCWHCCWPRISAVELPSDLPRSYLVCDSRESDVKLVCCSRFAISSAQIRCQMFCDLKFDSCFAQITWYFRLNLLFYFTFGWQCQTLWSDQSTCCCSHCCWPRIPAFELPFELRRSNVNCTTITDFAWYSRKPDVKCVCCWRFAILLSQITCLMFCIW